MRKWNKLPQKMQNEEVRKYYDIIYKRHISRFLKRCFDIVVSSIMILIVFPFMILISMLIKIDSKGPAIFRQVRVTRYMKKFTIYKFRTMIYCQDNPRDSITLANDNRITRIGKFLRKTKLDEIPQLFNVLFGQMSFVGTRPEISKYINSYTDVMYSTFLLPSGITSLASLKYKDESSLLRLPENSESIYLNNILPEKMKFNLIEIEKFSFCYDLYIIFYTFYILVFR